MGHDITAYKKITFLRRNMLSNTIIELYKALDAEDYYAGVSGNGYEKLFRRKDIENAITKLNHLDDNILKQKDRCAYVAFLTDILSSIDGDDELIQIAFH